MAYVEFRKCGGLNGKKDLSGKNDTKERLGGTVSSSIFAMMQGVQVLRTHDVNELIQQPAYWVSRNIEHTGYVSYLEYLPLVLHTVICSFYTGVKNAHLIL